MLLRSWLENLGCGLISLRPARQRRRLRQRNSGLWFQAAEVCEERCLLSAGALGASASHGDAAHTAPSTAAPTILTVTSLADSGKGTLRDAILRAEKGGSGKSWEIDIAVTGTILLESQLPDLTTAITIKGLGISHTSIQRDTLAAAFRIVTVDPGQTAVLSNLGIAEGDAGSGVGGAIDNFGNLTLDHCLLAANSADQGGAVANEAGASLVVTATTFTGNHSSDANAGRGGGAIWNNGSLALQGGSTFDSNTASRDGGAVFNTATLTAANSTFTNNSALFAGAIFTEVGAATIASCGFSQNSAVSFGGAIENFASATVTQSSFSGNSAAIGGGIENETGATLTVSGSNFASNSSTVGGGAINNNGNLSAGNTVFAFNTSAQGGGIASDGSATVTGCAFNVNKATDTAANHGGGAIWNNGSLIIGGNSGFNGNTAQQDAAAILNLATTTLTQTSFSSNTAQGSAGAIENYPNAHLTIGGGTSFANNTGGFLGGAILSFGTLDVNAASFQGNNAQYGGGIFAAAGTAGISGSSFGANTAGVRGGALYSQTTGTVSQSSFDANIATYGGAIENAPGANLTLGSGTAFRQNSSASGGGAVNNNGTLTATGASFLNNTSADGGALATDGSATINGCTFTGNHAGDPAAESGGGAIWNNGSLLVQGNSVFDGNSANRDGAAVFNRGTATLAQVSLTSNVAGDSGGAIANDVGANLTISPGTRFANNSAGFVGGAIVNVGTLGVDGASFIGNAAQRGGAIESADAAASLAQCSFTNNTAQLYGGAIEDFHGSLTLAGCDFGSNSAGTAGGAIIVTNGALNASGCNFESNTAGTGGAIENFSGVATLLGCSVRSNTASLGGGINTDTAGTTDLIDSIAISNTPDDTHTEAGSTIVVTGSIVGVQT